MKKSLFTFYILFSLILFSCTDNQTKKEKLRNQNATQIELEIRKISKKNNQNLKDFIKSLPLELRIAQMFMINLEGNEKFKTFETLGEISSKDDKTPLIAGGYLFFSYNLSKTRQETKDFINSINDFCTENKFILPFLALDQEGGLVTRLKDLNEKLPSQENVAKNYSIKEAYDLYSTQALQMKDLGFNMNLAPVLEICTNENKDFLMGRSFGNENQVFQYGKACVNAYENNDILTVLKHFPGNTNTDPHSGLPEINLSKDELFSSLEPFKKIIKNSSSSVLMSHARTKAIDSQIPSCLSKEWVTDILKNQFECKGIIFSDDILMGALKNNGFDSKIAVEKAINAGIDCIMISEKRFAKSAKVLYDLAINNPKIEEKINQSVYKILTYKIKFIEQNIYGKK